MVNSNYKDKYKDFNKVMTRILVSASKLSDIGFCMYNLHDYFDDQELSYLKKISNHSCEFCHQVRRLPGARSKCIESDVNKAVSLAIEYKRPFFHTCHAGLTELVIPISVSGSIIATVFCGQCRLVNETNFNDTMMRLKACSKEAFKLKPYFDKLPIIDRSRMTAVGTLLDLSIKQALEGKDKKVLEDYFNELPGDYVTKAKTFIKDHYMESITLSDIAKHVNVSEGYLCRLFKTTTEKTISSYITEIRIRKAKKLLTETNIPISNIAFNVGFKDCNYFSRKFRSFQQQSPTVYRSQAQV